MNKIYINHTIKILIIIFLNIVCFLSFNKLSLSLEKDSYTFVIPLRTNVAGRSAGELAELMSKLCKILSKKTALNITFQPEIYDSTYNERTLNKLLKGNIDFAYIMYDSLLRKNIKIPPFIKPLFAIMMNRKLRDSQCLIVKKSDNIENVSQLKGKRWGSDGTVFTRKILAENGFNVSMTTFFGDIKYVDLSINYPEGIEKLLKGDVDVLTVDKNMMMLGQMLLKDEDKTKIKTLSCTDTFSNPTIIYNEKKIDKELVKRIKEIAFKAHIDKDFESLRLYFVAMNGKLAEFNNKELEKDKKLIMLEKEMGWLKEEEMFKKQFSTKY